MACIFRIAFLLFFSFSLGFKCHAYDIPDFSTFLQLASPPSSDQLEEYHPLHQIPVISGIKPSKNPGPQPDTGLAVENRNLHEIEDFSRSYPDTDFSADKWDICRMDDLDRCTIGSRSFRQRLKSYLLEHAPHFLKTDISSPFLYLESLNDGTYIIHRAPLFPQGAETEIIAAIISEDLRVHNVFKVDLSSRNGLSTGHGLNEYTPEVRIAGTARFQDSLIIALDASARCGSGKRMFGFLVRFSLKDYKVKWVTPYNTASGKFAVVDDLIYSSDGGSCEKDYLYVIDANNGHIVARDILSTAFNWLFSENGRLFGQTYDSGFVYRLQ